MDAVDPQHLATSVALTLPPWLIDRLPALPGTLPDHGARMDLVNDLAGRNHLAGNGGPFAAIVVDPADGSLVSVGVNVVLSSGMSAAHAEVMALSLAQQRLGDWDLGAGGRLLELVVNWRPCVMCGGAAMWSGVRRIVIPGHGPELEELTGFDEGPSHPDIIGEWERRGIEVVQGIRRAEALAVFAEYGARQDVTVYNARGRA